MGLITAKTGPELMSGNNENVSSDYDGRVGLAPTVNLLPDPGMRDFDADSGKHRYWKMRHAKRPTHWAPFARDRQDQKQFGRQVTGPLPMSDHSYDIEELFPGSSPIDENQAIALARPAMPRTKVIYMAENVGFPAGWITVAYGWILGDDFQTSERVTNPGPRSEAFEIGQGMGFMVATPGEIPSGATGVAFFVSEPKLTATAALTAPMYLTNRFRTRGIEQFLRVTGPLNLKDKFLGDYNSPDNPSYVGSRQELAGIDTWRDSNPLTLKYPIEAQMSYSVYTDVGKSMSAPATEWKTCSKRQSIGFKPKSFVRGIIGWQPEVRFRISNEENENNKGITEWYKITRDGSKESFFSKSQNAHVYASSPGAWPKDFRFSVSQISRSDKDTTGLPAPAEPVEVVEVLNLNNSALATGKHFIKTALFSGEDEGPASTKFATVDIDHKKPDGTAASEAIRVFRPLWHNRMDNAEAREKDLTDIDIPRGWWIAPKSSWGNNVTVRSPEEGIIKYFDASNSATDFDAFRTPIGVLEDGKNKYNLRYNINITGYQRGRVRVYLEEYGAEALYNDDAAPIRTQLIETHGGNHEEYRNIDMQVNNDLTYSPKLVPLTTSTLCVRLLVRGMGSGRSGTRNFDVEFSHFGFFTGWGRPRKQNELDRDIGDDYEFKREEHPHGGYCVIRRAPSDAPQHKHYNTIERIGFNTGISPSATLINTHNQPQEATRAAAIYGGKGLRIAKTTVTDAAATNVVRYDFGATNAKSALVNMIIMHYSNNPVELCSWRDQNTNRIAHARLTATGTLEVVYTNSSGVATTVTVFENVENGEAITLEMAVNGSAGTLRVRRGRTKYKQYDVADISGIAWGNKQPRYLDLGYNSSATTATSDVYYDDILITDTGSFNTTAQGGNYIEYYGPDGTPMDESFGPTGMPVPVRANQFYTIGANMWYSDAPGSTSALRVRAMSKKHEELKVFTPVVNLDPNTHKEREWERYTKTIRTPEGTSYLEFFANGLSSGTVRLHGIQLEKGQTASPFSMTNASNGWFNVYLSTRPEGVGEANFDPVYELGKMVKIKDINVIGTDETGTSWFVQYRTGNTFAQLDSRPYQNLWTTLEHRDAIIEVRVNLATNNPLNSPVIRRIEIEALREHSHLGREDGTEYKGASIAKNISAVHAPPHSENIELASGAIAEGPWGTRRPRYITFDLEVFRKSTVEEIVRKRHHTLFTPWGMYKITFDESPTFDPQPQTRAQLDHDTELFQMHTTSITARVTAEEEYA